MIGTRTISGHSLPLNIVLVVLNLLGLAATVIGFHDSSADYKWLFAGIGLGVMLLSTVGLILFKGRLMIATAGRVIVGSLFIVSGLIKANDPVGFSYKLEEYFEDGALAYRIKEWFGASGFSLEFLIDSALTLSVIICILEILLGVWVLIGGKSRLTSWLLLLTMLFFTFLTWHTANCDPHAKFTDRDTYAMSDPLAQIKIAEAKTNGDVRIISKTSGEVVVEEQRSTQCVSDCGCFGDAMKGSVGRSLTPDESLWKDIVLLYLVVWIFAAQKYIQPNSVKQNWYIVPVSLLLIGALSWVFGWYFPLLFGGIALITALWIYRSGGRLFGNHWGSALMTLLWSGIFVWYVLNYDPLKDYRPFAVGSDLNAKMLDGVPETAVTMLVYKNVRTGETREYDAMSSAYSNSKIWENTDWQHVKTLPPKVIRPGRMASIDSNEFNPSLPVDAVTKYELKLPEISRKMMNTQTAGLRLKDTTGAVTDIPQIDYNVETYPPTRYAITDTIVVPNADFAEISARDIILKSDKAIVVVAKKLDEMETSAIPELMRLQRAAEKAGVPFLFVTNGDAEAIAAFRKRTGFYAPTFTNDGTMLKVISRSNTCVMILKKGVVAGKYTHHSIPDFGWIQKNLFKHDN